MQHKKRSLDINSPTVCGFGRQNGLNMVTSTPDGKKNPFNLGISKVLDFDRQSPLNLSEQLEGVDGKPLINISNKQAKTTASIFFLNLTLIFKLILFFVSDSRTL